MVSIDDGLNPFLTSRLGAPRVGRDNGRFFCRTGRHHVVGPD